MAGHEPQMLATIPDGVAKLFAIGNKLICLGSQRGKIFMLDFWNPQSVDFKEKDGVQVTSLCPGRREIEGDQNELKPWV